MKYAVIGLGAVGSIIGGMIHRYGGDIVLFGKKSQINSLKKEGLEINGFFGTTFKLKNLRLESDFFKLKEIDVVFICVKSQDTEKLANDIKDFINKKAVIVSLQNGVRNKKILEKITNCKTISGIILFNSVYKRAGLVNLTYKGGVVLECTEKKDLEISNLLKNAGFKIKNVEEINGYLYSKLVVNLQIAVTALTNQTITESIKDDNTRKILIETMSEGIEVIRKSGIHLKTLPDIDPIKMVKRMKNLNKILLCLGTYFMGIKKSARNSMWQSLNRKKQTEIDFINGEIVRLAKKNNLEAPINSKLVELIKSTEKNEKITYYEPKKLKEILDI